MKLILPSRNNIYRIIYSKFVEVACTKQREVEKKYKNEVTSSLHTNEYKFLGLILTRAMMQVRSQSSQGESL